jgi:TetR/AcrR family transcriptional regulator
VGTNRTTVTGVGGSAAGAVTGSRRGRPPAADSPASDAAILDAALEAFADNGFTGTSVRDLARRLGVSHNLLPQRFGSKERLWYAAVDHGFAQVARSLHVELVPDDPLRSLRNMIVTFVLGMATRPALLRILNQEAASPGPRLDHLFERHIGPTSQAVEQRLVELQSCGLARPIPRAGFYFLLTHGVAGPIALAPLSERFGHRVSVDDPDALREYAESIADLLINGIAAPQPARSARS